MAAVPIDYGNLRNPQLKKFMEKDYTDVIFAVADGHDHDGVNSKSLSPSAVIAAGSVATVAIVDGAVTAGKIGVAAVTETKILDSAVATAKIAADAVDGTKIADNAIDSEHYTDGSIDTAHIAALQITPALIAADAVETAKILDANVTNAKMYATLRGYVKVGGASDLLTDLNAKTSAYILVGDGTDLKSVAVSGNVTMSNAGVTALAADCVDSAEIADDAVDSEHIAAGAVDNEHLAITTTPMAKAIVAAHAAAIPVTGNGDLALTVADASETNTLAVPTFAGQEISISVDTLAGSGTRVITVASAINATGNDTITLDAAGDFIALRGVKLGASFAWHVIANDGAALSTA